MSLDLFIEKIKSAKSILIMGHRNPDGDSAGSVLAMRALLHDNFSKDADVAYDGNYPLYLDFLPGRADIWFVKKIADRKYDLIIMADVGSNIQIGDCGLNLLNSANFSVRIDHHKTEDWFGDLNFVDTNASSTAEIIFDIARHAKWNISKDAATCMYTGIYTDTGCFAVIQDGNAKQFLDAAELVKYGADFRSISDGLNLITRNDLNAQANVLSHIEFFYNNKLVVATIPNNLYKKLDSGHTDIVNNARYIKGVECLVVLKEARSDEVGFSIRSQKIPIRHIAERFGGGGHDLAAGGRISLNLVDAKNKIVKEFKEIF